jgi:hypothetical protein
MDRAASLHAYAVGDRAGCLGTSVVRFLRRQLVVHEALARSGIVKDGNCFKVQAAVDDESNQDNETENRGGDRPPAIFGPPSVGPPAIGVGRIIISVFKAWVRHFRPRVLPIEKKRVDLSQVPTSGVL